MPEPPAHDDRTGDRDAAEWARLHGIVEIICWTIALGAVPPMLHNAFAQKWASAAALAVAEAGVLAASWVNRRGRLDAAVWILLATVESCAVALVLAGRHGFQDVAMMLFPATLVVAGLLLDRRAFAGVAAATVLFVVGIGLAEVRGLLVTPLSFSTSARNVLDAGIIVAVTAVAVGLLAESLRASLGRARRNEERFRALVDLAVDGILIGDSGGRVVGANRRFEELTGRTSDELVGRALEDLFSPEEMRREPLRLDRVDRGELVLVERLLLRKDGTAVPVEMSSKRMPDGSYQSFFRDVTERRRAEEEKARLQDELRQAQKMEAVGRLAGGIAHDFNNMLMVIGSSVTVARRALASPARVERCLDEVERAASRAGVLTRQLLAFSRKQEIAPRVLDLAHLVANLRPMLAGVVGRDVTLGIASPPGPCLVRVDAAQMEQALLNLAVNARDAMPDGGSLALELSGVEVGPEWAHALAVEPGEYVTLQVKDTGTGMTEDVLQHVFEPFFTTKPSGKGTGLGLSMVYGALRQNGGAVEVDSTPGRGTTFRLFVPRARAEETAG